MENRLDTILRNGQGWKGLERMGKDGKGWKGQEMKKCEKIKKYAKNQ